jgi:hypothetical protein
MNPSAYTPPSRTRRLCTFAVSLAAAVLTTGLSIPTEAWAAEQNRAVAGFQAVALEGSATVKVSLAERESVRVSGEESLLDQVETVLETRKGVPTLVVRNKSSWISWSMGNKRHSPVVVTVQGPQFKALGVGGSGQLEAALSNQPSLLLMLAGSGDLTVKGLTAHQVDANVAGSGDVRVQGAAQNLSVNVAGSGDAWLKDLEAEDVRVSVAGSGDVRVQARQRLKVSIAGSGDVRYSGPAKDVSISTVGSGRVTREGS